MHLSSDTLNVLKNFSTINPSIMFKEGNVLKTLSTQKTIMAQVEVDDNFDSSFAVYDLNQFLSTLSLFEQPSMEHQGSHILISDSKNATKYFCTDPEMVVTPPDKNIELPDTPVKFSMTADDLKSSISAASVLQLPDWCVVGDGKVISIKVTDTKNETSNTFEREVGVTDAKFTMVFKTENLKLLPGDYDVEISSQKISHFSSREGKVRYWIATETNSSI
tara:strand:+ start:334 stop:993 length:660 start_codon:yes stop_codon:yes gene_type:complete